MPKWFSALDRITPVVKCGWNDEIRARKPAVMGDSRLHGGPEQVWRCNSGLRPQGRFPFNRRLSARAFA